MDRRAGHKSKLIVMEAEFSKLRAAHDAVVLENCHLQTELLKVKDRLLEAEEEKRKLIAVMAARGHEGTGTGSSSYTTNSSRSGTIVSSTAYTSSSCHISSGISMDAVLHMDLEMELRLGTPDEKDAEFAQPIKKPRKETEETLNGKRMKHIESLVQEFFRGSPENRSILGGGGGGGMSALERWFSELGVSWVLQLDVGAPALVHGPPPRVWYTGRWIEALTQIMETIHGFAGMPAISLDPVQFALFFQEAMSKMLVFIDVMFSDRESITLEEKMSSFSHRTCLNIHSELSKALSGIRLQFHSSSSSPAEVEKIEKEMISLLSAKEGKAFDTIWSLLEEIRTRLLKTMELTSFVAETPQGSSDIHEVTRLVMVPMTRILVNCGAVDPLFVSQAASLGKYVPLTGLEGENPFVCMYVEMVSCLEKKLITKSQSFLDKGLGLLFLLNNSDFIWKQLQDSVSCIEKVDSAAVISFITPKVDYYTERYIQVSWEPMLACLFNPTPLHLVRKYSPLSKFESEFQKTYTTQKLWKVPDPELRNRLRRDVIQKLIPGYTKYIEDNKVTNPKFTPQELEEMLQELFEG